MTARPQPEALTTPPQQTVTPAVQPVSTEQAQPVGRSSRQRDTDARGDSRRDTRTDRAHRDRGRDGGGDPVSEWRQAGQYAMKTLGPGRVVMSRKPEDVQAAWQEELRPLIEAAIAAYGADLFWWSVRNRSRSRAVSRRKQRRSW